MAEIRDLLADARTIDMTEARLEDTAAGHEGTTGQDRNPHASAFDATRSRVGRQAAEHGRELITGEVI